jgi:hypothetical protein
MARKSALTVLGLVLVVAFVGQAQATLYTETADWNYGAFGGSGSVTIQDAAATGGATYINSFGNALPGQTFRSLGAVPISQLVTTAGGSLSNVTGNNNAALLVFALQGVTQANGIQQFTQGAYEIINVVNGGTNGILLQNPSTWSGNVVAYGSLESPQNVVKGAANAYDITLAASQVNLAGPVGLNPNQLNGQAISTLQQPAKNPLLTNISGVTPGYSGPTQPSVVFANIQEDIIDTFGKTYAVGNYVLPSSELGSANTVYGQLWAQAGLSNNDPLGNPLAFNFSSNNSYSGSSGGGTDQYNPTTGIAGGDFAVRFNSDVTLPAVATPEPASLTVWGLVVALGATVTYLRARKR